MPEKRIDFRQGSFDALIEKHGYYLDHYHAIQCPCIDPSSNAPDMNCRYCINGWQYYGKEEIKGVIQNISAEKQFSETGGFLLGSMMLTVSADTNLAYHDRIINRKSVMPFSQLVTRGDTDTDRTRFEVVEPLRVMGKAGTVFQPATDFTIEEGLIKWVGAAPEEGDYFSIAYLMHPTWLCLQTPHAVRDTHIKFRQPAPQHHRLPLQALCRHETLCED
ncbi:MAG: hypothetical protein WBY88_01370 [Desulfosarcina sp.]